MWNGRPSLDTGDRRVLFGRSISLLVPGLVALDVPQLWFPALFAVPVSAPQTLLRSCIPCFAPKDPAPALQTLPKLKVLIPPAIPFLAHCPYLGPQSLSWPIVPPPAHSPYSGPTVPIPTVQSLTQPYSCCPNTTVMSTAVLSSLPQHCSDSSSSPTWFTSLAPSLHVPAAAR